MLLQNVLGLRFSIPLILVHFTGISFAENATVPYPTAGAEQQHLLTWTGGNRHELSAAAEYLKLSLKHELQKRLSPEARIILEGEEDFAALDARYTNYKRPWYITAVQVAEEQDVVETVSMSERI